MQHSSLGRVAAATSLTLAVVLAATTPAGAAAAGPETSAQEPDLVVQATPDPSPDGSTTIYVGSTPDELDAPPSTAIAGTTWYVAELSGLSAGAYDVTAKGELDGDAQTGTTTFEVTGSSAGAWAAAGPYDIGGLLTTAPSDPEQAVVAMTGSPNVWLTDDAGATWADIAVPVVSDPVEPAVVVDAKNPDEWWYATFDNDWQRSFLLHTTDRGRSWTLVLEVAESFVGLTSSDAVEAPILVTSDTAHVSTDDGATWEVRTLGLEGYVHDTALSGSDLLVGAGPSIWRFDDVASGAWPEPVRAYTAENGIVSGLVADPSIIATVDVPRGIVASTDGGTTWQLLREQYFGSVDLSGGVLMARDRSGWHISEDLGSTWNQIGRPVATATPQDFDVWADRTMTISTTAAMFRGPLDGSSYERIGVPGRAVPDLAVSGDKLLAATANGAYASSFPIDDPDWGPAHGEGTVGNGISRLAVDPSRPGRIWGVGASAFGLAFWKTGDNGATWEDTGHRGGTPTALGVHPVTGTVLGSFEDPNEGAGVRVSDDGGATWTDTLHGMFFETVAGDPHKAGVWWLGNNAGLWRTDDDGATIKKVSDLTSTAILFTEDGRLVVGGRGIRVSHNGGQTFRNADVVPASILVSDLVETGGRLYAGTTWHYMDGFPKGGRGVYTSSNGNTWTSFSGGLPTLDVNALAASPDGKTLYAGTRKGVYATPLG